MLACPSDTRSNNIDNLSIKFIVISFSIKIPLRLGLTKRLNKEFGILNPEITIEKIGGGGRVGKSYCFLGRMLAGKNSTDKEVSLNPIQCYDSWPKSKKAFSIICRKQLVRKLIQL
ncbi:hypothetical protein GCM10011418_01680 [Sphingobacterium alkalisoli]|nr:hypothetical protein GCM10011418_01680 [Sphingobacterium alkalisoli]